MPVENLPHLSVEGTATREQYVYAGGSPRTTFRKPLRDDRPGHATSLRSQLEHAEEDANAQVPEGQREQRRGITLEFRGEPGFDLAIESLENRRRGIELANVRMTGTTVCGTVFIPEGKIGHFFQRIEDYAERETKAGNPRHQNLVESISSIRLAAVEEFWTDHTSLFPSPTDAIWWEVWLRAGTTQEAQDQNFAEFVAEATEVGFKLGEHIVRFPERVVLLAWGKREQWAESINLLNHVAELRRAKEVPTEYIGLSPNEQAEFIEEVRKRLRPPSPDAPAVCLLDTGINRAHPLLEIAVDEAHVLSVDPNWSVADHDGHGTEMAGIALYGCLTSLLTSSGPVHLRHRLESVKVLPSDGQNDPEHYGAITQEAVSRAEVESPDRHRVACLTVTSDDTDGGLPTSWSAAVDQMCAGSLDDLQRLIVVSVGNLPTGPSDTYPDDNHQHHGVQDPAQSWNALSVGGFTEKVHITSSEWSGWQPVAHHGSLSPTSTTSRPWTWPDAPLKPDIVMEAGNCAVPPGSGGPDFVDDLSLLTTSVRPSGRLLTTTGETSAAAAQAARLAAIVQSHYPDYWPETIRGLLVHAARWTPRMLEEFPYPNRSDRLRVYGYGVPNPRRVLWSAGNATTLVIQDSLQPFDHQSGRPPRTKDMHVHKLPWPVEVLQSLGNVEVSMRVTLSYFIEPSPGRRGWTRRHRYQSHGLRFDLKRPTESSEEFRQRLTKSAWEDPDVRPDSSSDSHCWNLGARLRTRGSVHSDQWSGSPSELASSNLIGVFPVTGWWRERRQLRRWNQRARYALIVSIESSKTDVDLYTAVQTEVAVSQTIEVK